ncbi:MAG: hypothetical protein AAF664_02010 [Planctomycetota bacterium]
MGEILESLLSYLADNWPELLWIVIAASVASYLAGRRSLTQWRRRDFLGRLNVSLTYLEGETLRIRTILETDAEEIFLNASASTAIVQMAKKTTAENPLIPIPPEDRWFYLNSILNEISERFAHGHLKRAMDASVVEDDFLIALTCERAGKVRTQKIRALLFRRQFLENLPEEAPRYESPNHDTRWQTVQFLAERWTDSPDEFLELRLCL